MSDWIKTKEDLPDENEVVLCCDSYSGFITLGRMKELDSESFHFEYMYLDNIEIDSIPTHWMPLPNLPEVNDET